MASSQCVRSLPSFQGHDGDRCQLWGLSLTGAQREPSWLTLQARKLLLFFLSLLCTPHPPLLPAEAADSPHFLSGLCLSPPAPPHTEEVRAGRVSPRAAELGMLGSRPQLVAALSVGLQHQGSAHFLRTGMDGRIGCVLAQGTSESWGGAVRKWDLWLICTRCINRRSQPLVPSSPSFPDHLMWQLLFFPKSCLESLLHTCF